MPVLVCGFCDTSITGGVNELRAHYNSVHAIRLSASKNFTCKQGGCLLQFSHWSSLRKRIQSHHLNDAMEADSDSEPDADVSFENHLESNASDDDVVLGPEQTAVPNSDNTDLNSELRALAAKLIASFRSNSAVTGTLLDRILDEMSVVFGSLLTHVKDSITEVLVQNDQLNTDLGKAIVEKLSIPNVFEDLQGLDKQVPLLQEYASYIEPVEYYLGDRIEQVLDRKTNKYFSKVVEEKCQYIPLLKVLKTILSHKEVRDMIANEEQSTDGFLRREKDGIHFRNHPLFSQYPHGLRLQLYQDDIDVTNVVGSKSGVHKLGAFYWSLRNLPDHLNSKLSSIHLLLLCYANDIKKHSFGHVLEPFLTDLRKLEEGVTFVFDGEEIEFRGTVFTYCGDTLAAHQIFGLLGPSANLFCRMCLIHRSDLLGDCREREYRTRVQHQNALEMIKADPINITATGVKSDSALHFSRFFHITENFSVDSFHDFFEGIFPYELKLVLNRLVCVENRFNIQDFNSRLYSFHYGPLESKIKPTPNFTRSMIRNVTDHSIRQSGSQSWCLMRIFQFIVSDWVDSDHIAMRLILNLLSIMDIIFAPKLHVDTLALLETYVSKHFLLFKEAFPEHRFINKHHRMSHYPKCIAMTGPSVGQWCMRYEGKHQTLNRHGGVCCNFVDLPKTLSRVCQMVQCCTWGRFADFSFQHVECSGGVVANVEDLPFGDRLLEDFDVLPGTRVFVPRIVKVFGNPFKKSLFVVIRDGSFTDEDPTFGRILEFALCTTTWSSSGWKYSRLTCSMNLYMRTKFLGEMILR